MPRNGYGTGRQAKNLGSPGFRNLDHMHRKLRSTNLEPLPGREFLKIPTDRHPVRSGPLLPYALRAEDYGYPI